MTHRHLDYPAVTPPGELPSPAIVDILDRGDLAAWRPIARATAADPHGELADRVSHLIDAYPMYGTSRLWRAWIDRHRARGDGVRRSQSLRLAELRRAHGLTQTELAQRLPMSQSDLSKLERRRDVKLSTLRAVADALGYRLRVLFAAGGTDIEIITEPGLAQGEFGAAYERAWAEEEGTGDAWDVAIGDGLSAS